MLSNCSQARSLSPTQAAIIARFVNRPDFLHYIFFRMSKLDRMPAFTQRVLFPPEIGVDQPKQAQFPAIIRLGFDDFLVLRACSDKS